ncbi:MAG: alanine--tRNA ligase-related protein [Spirochaetia bacterium]
MNSNTADRRQDNSPGGSGEQLYYTEPYTAVFTAEVKAIERSKNGAAVQLDRTAFYPEGGGQPADHGVIGGVRVEDVKKAEGKILHYLAVPAEELEEYFREGSEVYCRIDWNRRYDFMQQHTGQHLLSAVMYRDFGYHTVSIHQGSESTSIEIETDSLKDMAILQIEERVLQLISENLSVKAFWIDEKDAPSYDLRREPKVSGDLRIVAVEGYDAVACGGIHTATTGEVRLVRCEGTEKIRGRVRLYWKIGDRAIEDYREKSTIVSELVDLFSSPQEKLLERIRTSSQELVDLRRDYGLLEERTAKLEAGRLLSEAGEKTPAAERSPASGEKGETAVITASYSGESKDFLRKVADGLCAEPAAAFCGTNLTEKGVQWIVALGEEAEGKIDFNARKEELLAPIEGRGGGKPPIRQGLGTHPDGTEEFFRVFRSFFTSPLD